MVKQYRVTVNGVSYDVTVESAGSGRGGYAPAYHPAPVAAPAPSKKNVSVAKKTGNERKYAHARVSLSQMRRHGFCR